MSSQDDAQTTSGFGALGAKTNPSAMMHSDQSDLEGSRQLRKTTSSSMKHAESDIVGGPMPKDAVNPDADNAASSGGNHAVAGVTPEAGSKNSTTGGIHISDIDLAEQMLKRLLDLVKKLKALASMHAVDSQ